MNRYTLKRLIKTYESRFIIKHRMIKSSQSTNKRVVYRLKIVHISPTIILWNTT